MDGNKLINQSGNKKISNSIKCWEDCSIIGGGVSIRNVYKSIKCSRYYYKGK